jgi:hypothetical protein
MRKFSDSQKNDHDADICAANCPICLDLEDIEFAALPEHCGMSTTRSIVRAINPQLRVQAHLGYLRGPEIDIQIDRVRSFVGARLLQCHAAGRNRWVTIDSSQRLEILRNGEVIAKYPGSWFMDDALPPSADKQNELVGTVNNESPDSEKEKGGAE